MTLKGYQSNQQQIIECLFNHLFASQPIVPRSPQGPLFNPKPTLRCSQFLTLFLPKISSKERPCIVWVIDYRLYIISIIIKTDTL